MRGLVYVTCGHRKANNLRVIQPAWHFWFEFSGYGVQIEYCDSVLHTLIERSISHLKEG